MSRRSGWRKDRARKGKRAPQTHAQQSRRPKQRAQRRPNRALSPQSAQPVAESVSPEPPRLASPRPGRWRTRRTLIVGISVTASVTAALLIVPVLFQAWTAYGKIFVSPSPDQPNTGEAAVAPATPTPLQLPDWDKQERVNILLLGSDGRQAAEIPRSDTVILVTIDPVAKQVGLLSIPRDLLVTIPGIGEAKINAAYPNGELGNVTGPGLVEATIEHNFGVPIHYFAEVDFQGFQQIVDTLGGVIIDVPAPIKDDEYPGEKFNYTRVYFHSGLQHMDGPAALRYVRTRHDDNDFARGERQQQMLRALREQEVDLNLITQAPELLSALGDTVRTNLQPIEVLKLAKLGTMIPERNIRSFSLREAVTPSWLPGQPYYLIPDWDKVRVILQQMMPGSLT